MCYEGRFVQDHVAFFFYKAWTTLNPLSLHTQCKSTLFLLYLVKKRIQKQHCITDIICYWRGLPGMLQSQSITVWIKIYRGDLVCYCTCLSSHTPQNIGYFLTTCYPDMIAFRQNHRPLLCPKDGNIAAEIWIKIIYKKYITLNKS